jgi:cytoskeletal protein RodZ
LTVSDIRRARRATGLSLDDIARATGIPAWRLRELEWGYLRNWGADDATRHELRRYARAAGLDEVTVLSVVWPLVESAIADAAVQAEAVPAGSDSYALVPAAAAPAAAEPAPPLAWRAKPATVARRVDRYRWAIALAAAVLIAIAGVVLGWDRPATATVAALESSAPLRTEAPAPVSEAAAVPAQPSHDVARRVSYVRPAPRSPAKRKSKPAPPPRKKSFLKRELFRIVFK